MHITPWSWPQLFLYLKLAGFTEIKLVPEPASKAKHLHERLLAVLPRLHCRRRAHKAKTGEGKDFWQTAATDTALLSRHLIVAAVKP
jgi:hypothetical protein